MSLVFIQTPTSLRRKPSVRLKSERERKTASLQDILFRAVPSPAFYLSRENIKELKASITLKQDESDLLLE